jgi:hypothetical protein
MDVSNQLNVDFYLADFTIPNDGLNGKTLLSLTKDQLRPPIMKAPVLSDGMRGCFLFSDTTAVIFNASPASAPADAGPPAVARRVTGTEPTAGSLQGIVRLGHG